MSFIRRTQLETDRSINLATTAKECGDEKDVGDKVGQDQSWHKWPSAPRALRLSGPFLPTYPFLCYTLHWRVRVQVVWCALYNFFGAIKYGALCFVLF